MAPYYDRKSPCRIRRFTVVFDRISPYYDTEIYDRNTEPCNTAKYGDLPSYTAEYGPYFTVYGRRKARPGGQSNLYTCVFFCCRLKLLVFDVLNVHFCIDVKQKIKTINRNDSLIDIQTNSVSLWSDYVEVVDKTPASR
ncbi:unnamed protein product [Rotaria socialis]|uniref:Uncharacterized protein n=1 Tax=Rotaria socialis TaxID=392032 RepID=A0A818LWS0_9BILA|nr:unnamed protein product [Rotaria socialis]